MLMPVEVYKKMKQYNGSKRKKHKGKLILYGKNCLHGSGSESEMLRLYSGDIAKDKKQGKKKGEMKQETG